MTRMSASSVNADGGSILACRGNRHGLQADRGHPVTLARRECPTLVALVRAGARFENGKLVERPDESTEEEAA